MRAGDEPNQLAKERENMGTIDKYKTTDRVLFLLGLARMTADDPNRRTRQAVRAALIVLPIGALAKLEATLWVNAREEGRS